MIMADCDTNLAMLMGMGATIEQASEILDENRGDIDLAMAQFCNMKISNKNKTSSQNIPSSVETTGLTNEAPVQYKAPSNTSRPLGHRRHHQNDDDPDDSLISPPRPREKLRYGGDKAALEKENVVKQGSSVAMGATNLYAAQQRFANTKMAAYSTPSFSMPARRETTPSLIPQSSYKGQYTDDVHENTEELPAPDRL